MPEYIHNPEYRTMLIGFAGYLDTVLRLLLDDRIDEAAAALRSTRDRMRSLAARPLAN